MAYIPVGLWLAEFDAHLPAMPEGGCWIWAGEKTREGYGRVTVHYEGRRYRTRAHRLAYLLYAGPVPDGLVVRHACDCPSCCNPDHLVLGTPRDNVGDMVMKGRASWQRGTHVNPPRRPRRDVCAAGHPMTPENVYVKPDGKRRCRVCKLAYNKAWKLRRGR